VQNEAVTKYLDRYAEAEAAINLPGRHYDYSLVIPAFNEDKESVVNVWQKIKPGTSFLVILVVNSHIEEDLSARMLVDGLTSHRTTRKITDRAQLVEKTGEDCSIEDRSRENNSPENRSPENRAPDLLIIDRFSRGYSIDRKRGVGLARRIGMDIAASLINQGVISGNWLFTTDADAELPENYFDVDTKDTDAALIYPFKHFAEPGLELPMQLYEISMLYYAAGLRWANSPYAYPTIGSTISCSPGRYASVRGFPRRNTGEDFYLLNKLRKTGEVRLNGGEPIVIAGRFSDRVPIGTGQAIKAIHELDSPSADFTFEHPGCFAHLKRFLDWLDTISARQPEHLTTGDPDTDDYVQQIGLMHHYQHKRRQSPTPRVMRKHLDDWFDGLKTRQFIHHFRDQRFGRITAAELGSAPFISGVKGDKRNLDVTLDITLDRIRGSLHNFIYPQSAR
jgi:hypothetical protein